MSLKVKVGFRSLQALVLALGCAPFAYAAPSYKVIQNFVCGVNSSCFPSGPMVFDKNDNVYGSATQGGAEGDGTVFELVPNPDGTWSQMILHSFDFRNEGESPRFGVVFDPAGNLYGTTWVGGPLDLGTVFELVPEHGSWSLALPYDKSSGGGVVTDRNGNIYGAIGPGNYKAGAVGELSPGPNGWTYAAQYSFCAQPNCADGDTPASPLTFDAVGNLYGTTTYGGNEQQLCTADTIGCGVAFQLSPNRDGTWTYHLMHAFAAFSGDGQTPSGPLVMDRSGSIYGTTLNGGPTGGGTVFKLTPSTLGRGWKETVLYTFPNCSSGCSPLHGLAIDQAGNLYGAAGGGNMLCLGGTYCGVVFELSPQKGNQWTYTVVHKFNGTDGWGSDTPTVGPDGNIYGVTLYGGQNNQGVAYEITP